MDFVYAAIVVLGGLVLLYAAGLFIAHVAYVVSRHPILPLIPLLVILASDQLWVGIAIYILGWPVWIGYLLGLLFLHRIDYRQDIAPMLPWNLPAVRAVVAFLFPQLGLHNHGDGDWHRHLGGENPHLHPYGDDQLVYVDPEDPTQDCEPPRLTDHRMARCQDCFNLADYCTCK